MTTSIKSSVCFWQTPGDHRREVLADADQVAPPWGSWPVIWTRKTSENNVWNSSMAISGTDTNWRYRFHICLAYCSGLNFREYPQKIKPKIWYSRTSICWILKISHWICQVPMAMSKVIMFFLSECQTSNRWMTILYTHTPKSGMFSFWVVWVSSTFEPSLCVFNLLHSEWMIPGQFHGTFPSDNIVKGDWKLHEVHNFIPSTLWLWLT